MKKRYYFTFTRNVGGNICRDSLTIEARDEAQARANLEEIARDKLGERVTDIRLETRGGR